MSNFCLSALLFLPPPHLTESTVLSLLPSLLPCSLHPSHSLSLSPPTRLISPPAFLQHLLSAHAFHLSYPGHVTPPFTLSLLQWGLGVACWGSEQGGLPDKLRFRRAENEGEGQQRPNCFKSSREEVPWWWTHYSGYVLLYKSPKVLH